MSLIPIGVRCRESDRDSRTRPLRDFAQLSWPFLSVWGTLLTRCFCRDLPELTDEADGMSAIMCSIARVHMSATKLTLLIVLGLLFVLLVQSLTFWLFG